MNNGKVIVVLLPPCTCWCICAGARARLSALPDDERRAAAADLTLKLSTMMGLGEDTDSGSEDVATADDTQPQQ